jgi:hypothetical protein
VVDKNTYSAAEKRKKGKEVRRQHSLLVETQPVGHTYIVITLSINNDVKS